MFKIQIIQVAKTKNSHLDALVGEYLKMLQAYAEVEIITVKECNKGSAAEIALAEGKEIQKHLPAKTLIVALSEEGGQFDSRGFAKWMEDAMQNYSRLVFVIGGAFALSAEVKNKADLLLSFSKFTFTHQMIRPMLVEQLFRAFTIINNRNYHH